MNKPKLIRISTVSISLDLLLRGQLNFLNNKFDVTAISTPDEILFKVAKRENVRVYGLEMKRRVSILNDIYSFYKLWVYLLKNKPIIIHSITPKAGLLAMLAGKLAGVPIRIHTFTGLIFPSRTGFMHWLLKNMDRLTCFFATHIIPEGEGVKKNLIDFKITAKPLAVIGSGSINGIDISYFDPTLFDNNDKQKIKRELKINPNDFVFIFVGRLVGDKGINELISAFEILNKIHSNTKLLLVGDYEKNHDPLKSETLKKIELDKNILTVGFQNDVRPYLSISDVLIFPSYREGFPNVVMQAGAMGLPSIVTDINGCNEIIKDNINGLFIDVKNIKSIVEKMCYIYENRVIFEKTQKNARPMIVERYQQKIIWDSLLSFYLKLENEKNI